MKSIVAGMLGALLFPIAAMGEASQPLPPAKAASKKAAQPVKTPQPPKPGQVTVFIPSPGHGNAFTDLLRDSGITEALRSDTDVMIDRKKVGQVGAGKPLTVTMPAGPHGLHTESSGALAIPRIKYDETALNVTPNKVTYFYITYNSFSGSQQPIETDPATAQALMNGVEPKASGTATIYIYWQPALLEIGFLKSDFNFFVDGQRVGTMTSGDFITATVPSGRHVLTMDGGSILGPALKQELILGAGIKHYYLITKKQYMEFYQLTPEQVSANMKSYRQR